MDDVESKFVRLYVIEEKKYSDIQKTLGCDLARVRELFACTAKERKLVGEVKKIYKRKKLKKRSFSEIFIANTQSIKKSAATAGLRRRKLTCSLNRRKYIPNAKQNAARGWS